MKTRKEILVDAFEDTCYLNDYVDIESVLNTEYYDEITSSEQLQEVLYERINEVQIIYYASAINILKEEDQSLTESLDMASEYGYELKNLNSEILATLLIQSRCFDELSEYINEVEELFND